MVIKTANAHREANGSHDPPVATDRDDAADDWVLSVPLLSFDGGFVDGGPSDTRGKLGSYWVLAQYHLNGAQLICIGPEIERT